MESEPTKTDERDHLFISYAWENAALADWLTLKLTACGYRVWCDRFKLLGGDPWPTDIDEAIKTRTFRVIHLLSRHSLHKANPSKERELALAISKEHGPKDFLIPLNVDGITPAELTWRLSDITFLPFESWSSGLAMLLKKLESIAAPKPLSDSGGQIAAQAYLPPDVISDQPEQLITNCVAVEQIPKAILRFQSNRPLGTADTRPLADRWAFRQVDERLLVSFEAPPDEIPGHMRLRPAGAFLWAADNRAHGISTRNLVSELIKKSVSVFLVRRGLRWSDRGDMLYIPPGLLPKDRVSFVGYSGRATYVQAGGERSFGATKFRYRLGLSLYVRQDVLDGFVLILRPRLRITDTGDQELGPDSAFVRRKRTARSWFNHEWVNRVLALFSFFSEDGVPAEIVAGDPGKALALATELLSESVAPGILEQRLLSLGHTEAEPPLDAEDQAPELDEPTDEHRNEE